MLPLKRVVLIAITSLLLASPTLQSQTTGVSLYEMSLEELLSLTISPRKFEESYSEVAMPLTVITQNELENHKIKDIYELSELVPNLSFNKSFGRIQERPAMRGLANLTGSPVVGILIDGLSHSRVSPTLSLHDIERIEIMKGSEVALYGRSTFAGAINFIPIKPSAQNYLKTSITSAQSDEKDISVLANIAPLQNLSLLASGRHYKKSNNIANTLGDGGGGYGQEQSDVNSLSLSFKPADSLEIYARITHQDDEDGHTPVYLQNSSYNNCYLDTQLGYYCGELQTPTKVGFNNRSDLLDLGTTIKSDRNSIVANWENAFSNLRLAYSYNHLNSDLLFDSDLYELQTNFFTNYHQEFIDENIEAIASFQFPAKNSLRVGISNFNGRENIETTQYIASTNLITSTLGPPQDKTISNTAVFLSYTQPFNESLRINVDLRQARDKISYRTNSPSQNYQGSNTWYTLSPKVLLEYWPTSKILVYTSVTQSNKPGNFNINLLNEEYASETEFTKALQQLPIDEEELISYEIGTRNHFLNNSISLNANFFYYDWKDLQLTQSLAIETTTRLKRISTIQNGGEASSIGGELDFQYELSKSFDFKIGVGYAKTRLTDTHTYAQGELTGDTSVDGKEIPNWPTLNGSIQAHYKYQITNTLEFYSSASVTYEDERFVAEHNLATIEDSEHLNLSLGLRSQNWSLSIWGKDLGKDRAIESAARLVDFKSVPFSRAFGLNLPNERQIGVSVNINLP